MKYLLLTLGLIILFSCQKKNEYIKHEMGFDYVFFQENKDADKPKIGDVMVLSMSYYYNGDSLLFSSSEFNKPFRMKLKRTEPKGGTIDDALSMMHIGDSASFKVNASVFYNVTKKQAIPVDLKQDDEITFYVKLKNVISYVDFQKEKAKQIENDTPEKEQEMLTRYIKMSNITEEPTNSGMYFIEEIEGKGPKAKRGSQVTLHYLGYYINGESFSSTYDSGKPFTFVLGKDDLVAGFQEGVSKMQEKGHYKLVIPSYLAYGKEGNSVVPPNKTLIFEIDVLSIK